MTDFPYQNNPVGTGTLNTPETPPTSKNRTLTPEQIRGYDSYSRNELIADVLDLRATLRNADSQIKALTAIADGQQGYKDHIERLSRELAMSDAGGKLALADRDRLRTALEESVAMLHRIATFPMGQSIPGNEVESVIERGREALSGEPNSAPETPAAPNQVGLLPCPFCGGEADFEEIAGRTHDGVDWSVGCHDEECFGYQAYSKFPTRGEAAAAWNRRMPVRASSEGVSSPDQTRASTDLGSQQEPSPVAADSAHETTASPQAPIVRVVIENGKAAYTTIYAPGLPDGTHDLYCEPEAVAPMMRAEAQTSGECPVCLGERRVTIGRRAIGQDSRVKALQMMYVEQPCPMCNAQKASDV